MPLFLDRLARRATLLDPLVDFAKSPTCVSADADWLNQFTSAEEPPEGPRRDAEFPCEFVGVDQDSLGCLFVMHHLPRFQSSRAGRHPRFLVFDLSSLAMGQLSELQATVSNCSADSAVSVLR